MNQQEQAKKPARSDRICHVNTRDRPFYKFEFGNAFILYVECLGGIISSLGVFFISMPFLPSPRDAVAAVLAIALVTAFVLGYALTKLLFFLHRPASIKAGIACMFVSGVHLTGLALLFRWIQIGGIDVQWMGVGPVAVAWVVLVLLYRRYDKIGLFTDGIKIGPRVFLYPDLVAIGHGTGTAIEEKIPVEGKGKPVTMLTPIEYEYTEGSFGIFHVYLILVTADAVYVAQSLNKQSNLAQDTRNAWSRCVLGHE